MQLPFFRSTGIFLLLIFNAVTIHAQDISFTRVSAPEGRNWNRITGIAQDPRGYIWISTLAGLFRYDGRSFDYYKNNPKNPNSLSTNAIASLCIDVQGRIWMGTFSYGMDCLDPEKGIFTHYRHDPNNPNSLTSDSVNVIMQDHNGMLWIGTQHGLNRLDLRTNTFTHFLHDPNDANSISFDLVWVEYEDKAHKIWIGCGSPFFFNNPQKKGGLNCLDTKTGKFTRYLHHPNDPSSIADDRVGSIFEDSKGNFWIGTCGENGLQQLNRKDGSFKKFPYDPLDPEKLSRPPSIRDGKDENNKNDEAYDEISFITEDAAGQIWIGTLMNGITRYNPKTKKTVHYDLSKDSTLSGGDFTSWRALNSKDGSLWIGTLFPGISSSLYRVDPFKKDMPYFALGTAANSFFEDSVGNLWLATQAKGLIRKDKSGRQQRFSPIAGDPASLSSEFLNNLRPSSNGRLWVTSVDKGLNEFDPASGICSRYQHDPSNSNSLVNDSVNWICPEDRSILWIGTRNGLDRMQVQTKTFTHFIHKSQDTTSLSNNYVICILKDRNGDLWVGTRYGLNRLERNTNRFKHYLGKGSSDDPAILSICQDAAGTLWVGTNEGFYEYYPLEDNFSQFRPLNGDKVISNVFSITEDNEKNLWLSCPDAIIKINNQHTTTSSFGSGFGIHHNSFFYADNFKGADGKLYIGDQNGYYAFFPEEFIINTNPPIVNITDFRLGNQSVKPGKESILKEPINKTSEINLGYRQNIFAFEFLAMDYLNTGGTRYYYMLENYDADWREASADNKAYYFNILPGKYIFHVKAYTSFGIAGEKTITVIINPPWWRTWWAYTTFGLLFATSLWAFIYYRSKKLRSENRILEEKVAYRTEQLKQSLEDLKSTQAQLIQSEKMASLGELTAGIAHEIQNPLNFVNNFSEVNAELIAEMKQEIESGNMEQVKLIAGDIEENELKIIHHGKRADAIVKGMLMHSRTSKGMKEPTDVNALTDEYLRLAYHGLRAKDKSFNATMKTSYDETIGQINIIPQDIGRVILNLITNAFYAVAEKKSACAKATADKQFAFADLSAKVLTPAEALAMEDAYEPTVSVSTKKLNGSVEVRVKDNGGGIPQKVMDKIFQPFFTTKPAGQGTGLGLSLSYDIIKAHGGEIKLETKEGEGSEFIVQLPVLKSTT